MSPITLRAKAIIQNLCRQKLQWDDKISKVDENKWKIWLNSLLHLDNVAVKRCFKPHDFGSIQSSQLHLFADGSEIGYGACAYLRLADQQCNISCSLVIGKARLAPIKQMSIPRLELSGAVLACRLYRFLTNELEITIDQVTFWTDSMIVLGYIKNVSRRFKTFVGNRLSVIHDATSPDQWHYVDSSLNPVDIASRGIDANDKENLKIWLNGPEFLSHDSDHWPHEQVTTEVAEDDIELKKETVIFATSNDFTNKWTDNFSNWKKLLCCTAWLIKFKSYCRYRYTHYQRQFTKDDINSMNIQKAEHDVLLHV